MLKTLISALVFLVGTGLLVGCDDDKLKSGAFPDIQATPEVLTLTTLPVGESVRRTITVRNAGGEASRLIITHIELSNELDPREFSLNAFELPLTLRGHESLMVEVTYAPQDASSDSGALRVRSNDPDTAVLQVPINTTEAAAEIEVHPPTLNFGPTVGGVTVAQSVTVTNSGATAVPVTSVHLADGTSVDYTITAGADARPELSREVSLTVEVSYTPVGRDSDSGTLVIETSNLDYPQILVPITGTEPSPDIEVGRPQISFGAVDLGADSDVVDLTVANVGSAPLSVSSVAFRLAEDGVNEQFQLHDVPETFPTVLAEGESFTLGVSYHPRMDGHHETILEIESDDPDEPLVEVKVDGRVRAPCIQVTPESIDLGVIAQGVESIRQPVLVTNCGDLPLRLTDLRIEGDAGFSWGWPDGQPEQRNLAPLTSATMEVWFTNNGLAEGAQANAGFLVENDTPDQPIITVPLVARGGGAPTCDLRLLGDPINFGFVSRGTSRSRPIDALNVGTGNCEVRSEMTAYVGLLGGANPFLVTGHLPRLIGPGGRMPVTVEFHPLTWGPMAGTLTVEYFNPYLMQLAQTMVNLNGVGGDSNIEVIPGHLDFGLVTAGDCASRTERVTIYNTGLVDLCITAIDLVGPGCAEFFIVNRPVANADGCIVVTRNRPGDVELVYEPGDLGEDECDLVFRSDASDTPELHVPLTGTGTADRTQTDEFVQGSGQEVDVLFMIDNSGSMSEEQENLARNFSAFIRGADQFQNNFQIGIVNSEADGDTAGVLVSSPRIIRRSPQTEQQFQDSADVGIDSAQDERGLGTVHRALTDPNIFDSGTPCQNDGQCMAPDRCVEGGCGGANRGFLRENAALELIFLSDEEDQSAGTVNFYVDFFKSIKGFRNEARMHAHAIVGADDQGNASACMSADGAADAGRRYVEVAQRTNGTVTSICNGNFGDDLRAIGNQAFGLQVQFFLSRPAAPNTVEVEVDGVAQDAGWAFDQESNSVAFEEGSVPQPGAHIRISYEAQCFPRQNP